MKPAEQLLCVLVCVCVYVCVSARVPAGSLNRKQRSMGGETLENTHSSPVAASCLSPQWQPVSILGVFCDKATDCWRHCCEKISTMHQQTNTHTEQCTSGPMGWRVCGRKLLIFCKTDSRRTLKTRSTVPLEQSHICRRSTTHTHTLVIYVSLCGWNSNEERSFFGSQPEQQHGSE